MTTLSKSETSNSLEKSSSALKFADRIEYKGRSKEEVDVLTSMTNEGSWIKENYEDGWKRGDRRTNTLANGLHSLVSVVLGHRARLM